MTISAAPRIASAGRTSPAMRPKIPAQTGFCRVDRRRTRRGDLLLGPVHGERNHDTGKPKTAGTNHQLPAERRDRLTDHRHRSERYKRSNQQLDNRHPPHIYRSCVLADENDLPGDHICSQKGQKLSLAESDGLALRTGKQNEPREGHCNPDPAHERWKAFQNHPLKQRNHGDVNAVMKADLLLEIDCKPAVCNAFPPKAPRPINSPANNS